MTGGAGPATRSLEGTITSAGFASGDRVVVGHWHRTPIGAFSDVMWAEPDGTRILYVPDADVGRFITAIYRFERIEVVPMRVTGGRRWLSVELPDRWLHVEARAGIPFLVRRPRWFTRRVEGPIARRLLGVDTFGVTAGGVPEWYQADRWRPLRRAEAAIGDRSLGPMRPVHPAVRFGFSEPPRRPSWVDLRTVLGVTPALDAALVCRDTRTGTAAR